MILLLLTSLSLELLLNLSVRDVFQSSSQVLQLFCVEQFNGRTLRPLGGALVCGSDLSGSDLKNLFIDTGIYHVLVVSGAHLAIFIFCLNLLFRKLSNNPLIQIFVSFVLFLYALITGLQAPVVRALIQYIMIRERKISPSDVLLSYLYCLVFEPSWIHSLSLQLSTVATLAFIFPLPPLKKNILIYFAILPLLLPLGIRSPLVTVIATAVGPILELLMLPIFLFAMILKPIQPALDRALLPPLNILEQIQNNLPPAISVPSTSPTVFPIIYILLMWLMAELTISRETRRWHFREGEWQK